MLFYNGGPDPGLGGEWLMDFSDGGKKMVQNRKKWEPMKIASPIGPHSKQAHSSWQTEHNFTHQVRI